MKLIENPDLWQAIDDAILQFWPALDNLLQICVLHADEIEPTLQALLFGVIGDFSKKYVLSREESLPSYQALNNALLEIQSNPKLQRIVKNILNERIDVKIGELIE